MDSTKIMLAIFVFFSNFLILGGFFLLSGIVLCLIGIWVPMCLAIGVAFIAFDLIVSIIETVKYMLSIQYDADGTMVFDLDAEDMSDEDRDSLMNLFAKYAIPEKQDDSGDTDIEQYLKKRLDNDSSAEECVRVFKDMCKIPINDDLLLYECFSDTRDGGRFIFSLARQYPNGEDEYYQLHMSMVFDMDNENALLSETLWDEDVPDFWEYIRASKSYQYACSHKCKELTIFLDET